MPKKKKLKERQPERSIRQQEAQEAYREQKEREAERKPRQWPKGKILGVICLISLIFVSYGAWQYYIQPHPTGPASNLSLEDINQFHGKVIAIHFMYVGCGGQMISINDHQLKQLKIVCNNYCDNKPVALVTVAAATCPNSDLAKIRANYEIMWVLGNDYGDGKMDIFNAYKAYSIKDGTIVLIDKAFNVVHVYSEAITADTLSLEINQLLESD